MAVGRVLSVAAALVLVVAMSVAMYLRAIDDAVESVERVRVADRYAFVMTRNAPHGTVHLHVDACAAADTAATEGCAEAGVAAAVGYAHARDRGMAMLLTRTAARGQLSELLKSDPKLNAVDQYMRTLDFAGTARRSTAALDAAQRARLTAYCEGVNAGLRDTGRLLEQYLTGWWDPAPWTVEDSMAVAAIMAYVDLAESQYVAEKFVIQSVRDGVRADVLRAIFTPFLDAPNNALHDDAELVAALQRVRFEHAFLPEGVHFGAGSSFIPSGTGSNNWVVGGQHTASGAPIAADDPHLEGNRLPAIWYEVSVSLSGALEPGADARWRMGITLPGFPDVVMGRNAHLSWGFTYGFADQIDFGVYEVVGGRYNAGRSGDGSGQVQWKNFTVRRETVHRKGDRPMELQFFEADCGVIERDARDLTALPDGTYLLSAFVGRCATPNEAHGIHALTLSRTVREAIAAVRDVGISTNWLFAEYQKGNAAKAQAPVHHIAYAQAGSLPRRFHPTTSGLVPYLRSRGAEHAWTRGMVPADQLLTVVDPPEGYLVTANNLLQNPDGPISVNAHMGPSRRDRIATRLQRLIDDTAGQLTVEHQQQIQCDLHSNDAQQYMTIARRLYAVTPAHSGLRATPKLAALLAWDLRYAPDSRAAPIFHAFLDAVLRAVYGGTSTRTGPFGVAGWDHLGVTHPQQILFSYADAFHQAIWRADAALFAGATAAEREAARDAAIVEALNTVCAADGDDNGDSSGASWPTWHEHQAIWMTNILFAGELPRVLGFDYPMSFPGSHDTPCAGQTARMRDGDVKTFIPSWRFVSDLSTRVAYTALPGGVSGRRFSSLYTLGIDDWLQCRYKAVRPAAPHNGVTP